MIRTVELTRLRLMSVGELVESYAEHFGDTTTSRNKGWLIKRIAWRLQANVEGGLSERVRKRAEELADDADLRLLAPRELKPSEPNVLALTPARDPRLPIAGTVLVRQYKGRCVPVLIRDHDFEYDGQLYTSLSAVAKAITGSHTNGFHFFNLTEKS